MTTRNIFQIPAKGCGCPTVRPPNLRWHKLAAFKKGYIIEVWSPLWPPDPQVHTPTHTSLLMTTPHFKYDVASNGLESSNLLCKSPYKVAFQRLQKLSLTSLFTQNELILLDLPSKCTQKSSLFLSQLPGGPIFSLSHLHIIAASYRITYSYFCLILDFVTETTCLRKQTQGRICFDSWFQGFQSMLAGSTVS